MTSHEDAYWDAVDRDVDAAKEKTMKCTQADHARMKADLARYRAETTLVGFQDGEDDDHVLELRNCACGSTLATDLELIPVEVEA